MILGSTLTPVNHAVTVQVLELDVTRAVNKAIGLQLGLVGNTLLVGTVGIEVVEVEVAVGLEAPDFTILLTRVVGVDHVVAIPLGDLGLVVTHDGGGIEINIA